MNSTPSCYTIPAGIPFAMALARWIWEQYGKNSTVFTQALILLPNRRACQTLRDAFLELSAGKPILLPRIQPIGDLNEEASGFFSLIESAGTIPNAMPDVKRHLMLTQLVREFEKATTGHVYNIEQAAELANLLANFLDEIEREQLTLDKLETLVPEELAVHWQQTLRFLKIISQHWPDILAQEGEINPAQRRQLLLTAIATHWKHTPPAYPVIAAGSTGSQPATAMLLSVISRLPQGSVVLGGLDMAMQPAEWELVEETHPQYGFKRLLGIIGCERKQISMIGTYEGEDQLRTVFQPAESTAQWISATIPVQALSHISLFTADTQLDEARMIAITLREALETSGKTAALITPDRKLARMVIAQMNRFGIVIDDSAGSSLADTPTGAFLKLVVQAAASGYAPVELLSMLRHPLAAATLSTAECRQFSRLMEIDVLRGIRHSRGLATLINAATDPAVKALLQLLHKNSKTLAAFFEGKTLVPLHALLTAHLTFAEWLATSDEENGEVRLWAQEEGRAVAVHINELLTHAHRLPEIDPVSYPALFDTLLRSEVFRPRFGMHPRLKILSPIEARMQQFDRVILGELSEGSWPAHASADPWMSRPMRTSFGLPTHDRATGQSALDVYLLSHGPEVIWTRARKIDGTPSIASRWWVRLETLMKNKSPARYAQMQANTIYEPAKAMLDAAEKQSALQPPKPVPPIDTRPTQLSVTEIDKWLRDPYVIYAKRILKLRPLEELDQDPAAADFGMLIHSALEQFVKKYPHDLPSNAQEELLACGKGAFDVYLNRPAIAALWWPRFVSMAEWFIAQEAEHRKHFTHIYSEIKAKWIVELDGKPFTLTTQIDRLSLAADGNFSLVDYKTGAIPTDSDQLDLEALILTHGMHTIANLGKPASLEYWKLSGNPANCEVVELEPKPEEVAERLYGLIRDYRNPEQPYAAQTNPALKLRYNDYEQLTRRQEWETI